MGRLIERRSEEDDTADLVLDDVPPEILKKRAFLIGEAGVDPDVDQLTDLLGNGHLFEDLLGRLPGFFRGLEAIWDLGYRVPDFFTAQTQRRGGREHLRQQENSGNRLNELFPYRGFVCFVVPF